MPAPTGEIPRTDRPAAQRLVTPAFVLAWLVNFSQYLVFYLLVTTMALYAVREFAADDAASGFASSAFVVGATVARLVTGFVVDRLGRRKVMLAALAVVIIACALYLPAASLPALIAVRIVHGFAYAFASTAVMAIAQSVIPPARRAEGTGYVALGTTLATAVGPALGLFLVGSFSYGALFATALGTAVLGLVLALFLRKPAAGTPARTDEEAEQRDEAAAARQARFSLSEIVHPAVVPIGLFMVLIGLCYAGVITYLNAYAVERDLAAGAGLFFVAYAAAMLVMRFVLGRVQDQRGDNVVVWFGLVCFALALVVLAAAGEDWQVVVAGALTGLGYGTLMPAAQAIAVSAVPADRLGTGISTLLLLADVGIGLGPVLLGAILSSTGYGPMYLGLAGLVVVAGVFYQLVHGRHQVARSGRVV
ncbi:MFS transporter [Kocuria palustris]|uniref:MFS transporter n=1 Tax=Kocuria palustris TaxID=71999 RepID=UPI0011A3B094|nr:MFS transporter [Kocuria palustris]